ncbi:hypothetical protein PRZ48_015073 [Zasmidium cellare]|uniref:Flavin-containing monooxygenase n=1 Tax=Zasmidium cellare TaxID=395010 RepID=A0ABR0DY90_ZASCE|nr:hypothetical protein PRZ48_015073 [Zasmidium cellare]
MQASGLRARIFEQHSSLGGYCARPTKPEQALTVSNWLIAFSDFVSDIPDMSNWMQYPTAETYCRYLEKYAEEFGLKEHITYNAPPCVVTSSQPVYSRSLIVATGANQQTNPLPRGLQGYTGKVINISDYDRSFEDEVRKKDMRVLVVGGGESGADVAADLANIAPGRVDVLLRHYIAAGGRFQNKESEAKQLVASRSTRFPMTAFLETYVASHLSSKVSRYFCDLMLMLFWRLGTLEEETSRMCLDHPNPQASVVTKNQRMFEASHDKKLEIVIAPEFAANEKTVVFSSNGREVKIAEYDAIVLCTGFHAGRFDWLHIDQPKAFNPRDCWLHCFPPSLGNCLFFVGHARPQQGGIPAMAEILSRYIARILSGASTLPTNYEALAVHDAATEREYYSATPDLHTLVDYNAFIESVSRRIGCEPRLPLSLILLYNIHMFSWLFPLLFTTTRMTALLALATYLLTTLLLTTTLNSLFVKFLLCPRWPIFYRQRGPGARPDLLSTRLASISLGKDIVLSPLLVVAMVLCAFDGVVRGAYRGRGGGGAVRGGVWGVVEAKVIWVAWGGVER